jgi:hypothetical protein
MADSDLNFDWFNQIAREKTFGQAVVKIKPSLPREALVKLAPYKTFPTTLKPALEKVADYVKLRLIPRIFQQEGPGWAPLSAATQERRKAQGYNAAHPILYRTGDLFKELTDKSHPKHVEIIQTGKDAKVVITGSSEKFKANQFGSQASHLPARRMDVAIGFDAGNIKINKVGPQNLANRDAQIISQILVQNIRRSATKQIQARGGV